MIDPNKDVKLRPWTPEEAIGKTIKFKTFDQCFLITHANKDCFNFAGYNYSPKEVLQHCEQINGKPCGEVENE